MSRTKPTKPQGENAALREKVARMDGKLKALETALNEIRAQREKAAHPMMHIDENGKVTAVAPEGFDETIAAIHARLAKVETAVAGPQTPDVAGDVTNSDPQMPETE